MDNSNLNSAHEFINFKARVVYDQNYPCAIPNFIQTTTIYFDNFAFFF